MVRLELHYRVIYELYRELFEVKIATSCREVRVIEVIELSGINYICVFLDKRWETQKAYH